VERRTLNVERRTCFVGTARFGVFRPKGGDNIAQGRPERPPWEQGNEKIPALKGHDKAIVVPFQGGSIMGPLPQGGLSGRPWAMLSRPFGRKTSQTATRLKKGSTQHVER